MPKSNLVALAVQATGREQQDRIVSFAAMWLHTGSLIDTHPPISDIHLVFDPCRRSIYAAKRIHGFSERALLLQDKFKLSAQEIRSFVQVANIIVAYDALAVPRLNRELSRASQAVLDHHVFDLPKRWATGLSRPHAKASAWLSRATATMRWRMRVVP